MYTEDRKFNYEQPEMTYNKETGDVVIIEKAANTKTKIINNLDDLAKEKALLLKELDPKKTDKADEMIAAYAAAQQKFIEDNDINPSNFNVFSRDAMRVDVGMIVQRPPIFVHMRARDVEYMKLRS